MHPVSTLVFGGNGRLAGALRAHLPESTRFVARDSADGRCISVGDYRQVTPALFAGTDVVVNCVGLTAGDAAVLHQANVEAPVHLATLARAAGVRRFVHISSFSVLGRARAIDPGTSHAPTGEYGRSKLAAEAALLSLSEDEVGGFAVVPVRLPAIVGGGSRDKLRQLVALWLRLRRLPVPRTPVARSMISIELAARVLAEIARGDDRGVLHAADPIAFTYRDAAQAITVATGRRVGVMTLPDSVITPLERLAPPLFASLYAPSVLAPAINRAGALQSDLYPTIGRMAVEELAA
jgi:nucleoside-diphosphate-sugar epimerase